MEKILRNRKTALFFVLFLLLVFGYSNTLFAPFLLDDKLYINIITANQSDRYHQLFPPRVRHFFYLSLIFNHSAGGLNPFGYHLVNISLHFLTSFVIFFISFITIKRGTPWGQHAGPIAFITALAFALSPVHTETVTYISGRATGLSGFFFFSSLLLFILGSFEERRVRPRILFYLSALICFVISIFSKETGLILPALILLYDFCFMQKDGWANLKNRFLFLYLPLAACSVIVIFQVTSIKGVIFSWWRQMDYSYALKQVSIVIHGLKLLLFPIGLTFDYDFPNAFFPHPAMRVLLALFLVGLIIWAVKKFPKAGRILTFCVLWFLITVAPTNSFLPRLDLLSERNLYMASFGVFFLMASCGYLIFISLGEGFRKVAIGCLVIGLVSYATLLMDRNSAYRSNTSLWEDVVKKAPGKTRAWHNLSYAYLNELNFEKALGSLQGLIHSNPSKHYLADAHSKLGTIHSRQGNLQKAIAAYKEGIRVDPTLPINPLNLGGVYARQGNYVKARDAYEKAEKLFKRNVLTRNIPVKLYLQKAHVYFKLGLYEQAKTANQIYLDKVPGSSTGHALMGEISKAMGKAANPDL